MAKRKVLSISQEMTPYLPENEASLRGRLIPQGLQEKGFEVRTFMPKYGCINERRNQLHEVIRLSGMNLIIDDTDHPLIIKVATLQPTRMQVYFIDNDDYFRHSPVKELETHSSPEDNDERIMFFVRGVIETVKKLRWAPDVILCTGWIAALAPMYIKKLYSDDPSFRDTRIIFAITDPSDMPAVLNDKFVEKLKFDTFSDDDLAALGTDRIDFNALARIGMAYSDAVAINHADVTGELVDYARNTGKPVIDFQEDVDAMLADTIALIDTLKA